MTGEAIFLATLGQRPQAITMALDALLPRFRFVQVGLLHTSPAASDINAAYAQVCVVLRGDYPNLPLINHELCFPNGSPLIDIVDGRSAEAYFRAAVDVLRTYRARGATVHLLIAGGRKAMSIYATLAASLVFGEHDRVWTILAEPSLLAAGTYHAPPGSADGVQLVHLPLMPSRLLPGVLADTDVDRLLSERAHPRAQFLDALSPEEAALVDALRTHPYAGNDELGAYLHKSGKTIENQFRSIYAKLSTHFDVRVSGHRKRQVLLDVIDGRV